MYRHGVKIKVLAAGIGVTEQEYEELLQLFVDTSRHELKILICALDRSDLAKATEVAHSIKGAAMNLNLTALAELGGAVEYAVKNRCFQDIEKMTGEMVRHINKLAELCDPEPRQRRG